jgi:hypothetical protein
MRAQSYLNIPFAIEHMFAQKDGEFVNWGVGFCRPTGS